MHPAIFLDRDGVIIENRADYVRSWSDVVFIPHALDALARASRSPYQFVIITNQSAVGRGILSYSLALEINQQVVAEVFQSGGRIDGSYICPHSPLDGCECRKPKPGLLLQAAKELSLDLANSIMIGDALTDIKAGQSAGVYKTILLRTGRGTHQSGLPQEKDMLPFVIYDTLGEALDNIL
jgi:D-glycero-D-manno-heptose 1,7-bisphosphate phosphatase